MKHTSFKHLLCPVLAALLLLSLPACTNGGADTDPTAAPTGTAAETPTGTPSDAPTEAPTEELTEAPTEAPTASPEDLLRQEDMAFLATITDHTYELTGEDAPYFVGRWFEKEIVGMPHHVTVTDGSQLYFLVDGCEDLFVFFSTITVKEEPYFAYIIDGGEPVRQHISDSHITLPDKGRHLVQIVAEAMTETESKWRNEVGFALRSIQTEDGGRLVGVKPVNKVIYYFGDSITEGIRALNMNATSDGNSATNAYPWYCSKKLGTVTWSVGYGATGIIQTGSFQTMLKAMDNDSGYREAQETLYPDVIVINHGTNDGGHPANKFIPALEKTLARLREKWPDTPVVYLIPYNQAQAANIRTVMADFENGYVVETADWALTYTDGVHPDAAGAKKAGEKLADALVAILGEEFFK